MKIEIDETGQIEGYRDVMSSFNEFQKTGDVSYLEKIRDSVLNMPGEFSIKLDIAITTLKTEETYFQDYQSYRNDELPIHELPDGEIVRFKDVEMDIFGNEKILDIYEFEIKTFNCEKDGEPFEMKFMTAEGVNGETRGFDMHGNSVGIESFLNRINDLDEAINLGDLEGVDLEQAILERDALISFLSKFDLNPTPETTETNNIFEFIFEFSNQDPAEVREEMANELIRTLEASYFKEETGEDIEDN